MPLKNYTTQLSAATSINQIQNILVKHGARSIIVNFNDSQEPESLSFLVPTKHGNIPFMMPANIYAVGKVLARQKTKFHSKEGQAARVAWRILKDWVDSQMAIIEVEMVTIEQVFLPYMQVGDGRTLYESMVDRGFYLTDGKS